MSTGFEIKKKTYSRIVLQYCIDLHITNIYRGSYMSVMFYRINYASWGKEIKCEACRVFYLFFLSSLINSIIQEHEC